MFGEAVRDSGKNVEEMRLEGAIGTFCNVTAMDIRGRELELRPPLLFDVERVGCTEFVVKDLEFDTMAALCEAGSDSIYGGEAVAVVAGLEWLHQDNIGVHMVGEHEEFVAASGVNREPAHVISVNFSDGLGCYVELF